MGQPDLNFYEFAAPGCREMAPAWRCVKPVNIRNGRRSVRPRKGSGTGQAMGPDLSRKSGLWRYLAIYLPETMESAPAVLVGLVRPRNASTDATFW